MKIKRINENTISCTITPEDLKANGFELDDFFDRKKEAVEFIRQTVAQIAISENFDLQGELTTMRVSVLPDHSLNLLITREDSKEGAASQVRRLARSIFDSIISKAAEKASEKAGKEETAGGDKASDGLVKSLLAENAENKDLAESGDKKEENTPVRRDAFMFSFFSVRDAMDCVKVFAGAGPVDSSFYYLREDDTYFLIVRRTGETPAGFEKCALSANEFGEFVTSEEQYIAFVAEHGVCVAREHAIEMFLNVIPGLKVPAGQGTRKADAGGQDSPDSRNGSGEM